MKRPHYAWVICAGGTLADRFGGSYKPSYILFGLMLLLSLALLHTVYVRLSAGKRP